MTNIWCYRDDCKHLKDGNVCGCSYIKIDADGECEDFIDYREETEWQEVFWKRMFDRDRNQEFRVKALGKKIEVGGRIFFIESRWYYANLTDAETGLTCGNLARLNENDDIVGKIKKKAEEYTPVLDLPVATYDNKTRKFSYPEGSEDKE